MAVVRNDRGKSVTAAGLAGWAVPVKVVVVLGEDLAGRLELNVTAFLIFGIATSALGIIGMSYCDSDGTAYAPMLRQPEMVMIGDA